MTLPLEAAIATARLERSARPLRVGVDIGGSKVAVLVVDASGVVRARKRVPSASADPDVAIGEIGAAVAAALATAGAALDDVEAVGIGVPGRVDAGTGRVRFAVNLGWHDLPLRDRLEAALRVPCVVDNDVRAAAAGLHRRSPFGPVDNLAYLSIGTGISVGVVLDGRLHRGVRGIAGEIGHVVLDPSGPECACRLHGCFEAVAAGPGIALAARDAVARGERTVLSALPDPTAVDVFRAAAGGDEVGRAIVAQTGRWVARGIHELALAYDVELVVLGGGVSRAGEPFLAAIRAALDTMAEASPFAREVLDGTAIRLLPADLEAGTWGAVALTEPAESDRPARPIDPVDRAADVALGRR